MVVARDWWVKMLMPSEGVVQLVECQGSEWLGDMFLCGFEDRRYYHEPKFRMKPQRHRHINYLSDTQIKFYVCKQLSCKFPTRSAETARWLAVHA